MQQRGINPLIATILLLLVVLAIGGIVWTTIYGQMENQQQQVEEQGDKFAGCASAGITMALSVQKPIVDSTNLDGNVIIKNNGDIDLNGFMVYTYYVGGTSDVNDNSSANVAAGMTTDLDVTIASGKTIDSIEVTSNDCDSVKTSVKKSQIEFQ